MRLLPSINLHDSTANRKQLKVLTAKEMQVLTIQLAWDSKKYTSTSVYRNKKLAD